MRERRTIDPRVLHLKLRVRAPKGTSRDALVKAIESAAATGILPAGYTLHWIDWKKGEEGTANSGRLTAALQQELTNFYHALTDPATRIRVERTQD